MSFYNTGKKQLKFYLLLFLSFALLVMPCDAQNKSEADRSREYKIKAAFLYNFIKFVDWPSDKSSDQNEPIIIGIIGKDPFGEAFDPIAKKQIKGRYGRISRFESLEKLKKSSKTYKSKIESIRRCHLVFICSSEKESVTEIVNIVDKHGVLTVSEIPGMLKSGVMINFVLEENKVSFEINLAAAKKNKLKIRSQLLRLAKRVVEDK
jgi:hypothetical protein